MPLGVHMVPRMLHALSEKLFYLIRYFSAGKNEPIKTRLKYTQEQANWKLLSGGQIHWPSEKGGEVAIGRKADRREEEDKEKTFVRTEKVGGGGDERDRDRERM